MNNGKWILEDDDSNTWRCPQCSLVWEFTADGPLENQAYHCPRCGERLIEYVETIKLKNIATAGGEGSGSEIPNRSDTVREKLELYDEVVSALKVATKELDALWSVMYGQNLEVAGWHLNGDTERMDRFFEENGEGALDICVPLLARATELEGKGE
jgi:predicted RNA-binding Zn-ribbon protein involved in translation (DUF1610 family)